MPLSHRRIFCSAVLITFLLAPPNVWSQRRRHVDLSHGGTVLLIGDSIFDCHEGDHRIEVVMERLLDEKVPGAHWTVINEAYGGEYIGPKEGNPVGVSEPLFSTETSGRYFEIVGRFPDADAIVVNYAANDSKVYPPAVFRKKLEMFGHHLEAHYPGAVMVFCTSMYLDPAHSAPYHIENPQAPGFHDGDSRNVYLDPYNQEIREFTAAHGYRLADIYRHLIAETEKGNWDLRLRADEADPKNDPQHIGDMKWFDNIHPNDQGTWVIARGIVDALTATR
jgi:lysophospholipase L1-like esterase